MNIDDDTLMAYADGELDPAQRTAVAAAIARDPALAAAVARHQALRQDVFAAFAGTLEEPVPARLQPPAGARVHDLAAARSARETAQVQRQELARQQHRRPAWPQWGAMAASLAVGVLAGALGTGWLGTGGTGASSDLARAGDGALMAGGRLAQALDRQLAQEGGDAGVRIGLSFQSRDGSYCRSFQMGASSGLACREAGAWRIPVLADAPAAPGGYRQAASDLPPAVLDAVDARMAGATLDAAAERAARDRGWQSGQNLRAPAQQ